MVQKLERFSIPNFNRGLNTLVPAYNIDVSNLSSCNKVKVDINKLQNMKTLKPIKMTYELPPFYGAFNKCPSIYLGCMPGWNQYNFYVVVSDGPDGNVNVYRCDVSKASPVWTKHQTLHNGIYELPKTNSFAVWDEKTVYFLARRSITDVNLYKIMDGGSSFSAISASPTGYYCSKLAIYKNFLFMVRNGKILSWSDYNAPEVWTGGLSGSLTFEENIIEILPLLNDLIIYCQKSIWRMSFIGLPTIFAREKIANFGIWTPKFFYDGSGFDPTSPTLNSPLVQFKERHYFVSNFEIQDIFIFDGVNFQSIGLPIKNLFWDRFGKYGEGWHEIVAYVNPDTADNEIKFIMYKCDVEDQIHKYPIFWYNVILNTWSYGTLDFTKFGTFMVVPLNFSPTYMTDEDAQRVAGTPFYATTILHGGGDWIWIFREFEALLSDTNFPQTIETKILDFDKPTLYKRLQRIKIFYETATSSPEKLTIYTSDNFNEGFVANGPYIITPNSHKYLDIDLTAKFFKFKLELGLDNKPKAMEFYYITRSIV